VTEDHLSLVNSLACSKKYIEPWGYLANRTFYQKNGSIWNHFGVPYMKRGMEPFLVLNRTICSKSVGLV